MATAKCLVAADVFSQKYGDDAAGGTRAAFILGSLAILPSEDVVSREPVTLSDEEKDVLSKSLALPPDRWTDLDVILAKYGQDSEVSIGPQMIFTEDNEVTCDSVLIKLREFFSSASDKDGGKNRTRIAISLLKFCSIAVVIYYFGNGRKFRGDWCFSDGFITFQDMMDVYMETYRGHVLTIVSDCSYSGNWVKQSYEFMDGLGISPCGHHAIEKGILLKVVASCRPTQRASVLGFSLHCMTIDKNHFRIRHQSKLIRKKQLPIGPDFTQMLCGRKVTEPCARDTSVTWETQSESERIYRVKGKDKERSAWYYILVVDDDETICKFLEALEDETIDLENYGQILYSGFGEEPPNEVTEKLHKKYNIEQ